MSNNLSKVVIVGRTNVGKSTLFNRLAENVKSITYDQEGVTRDIIRDQISWQGRRFDLIDTGGVSFKKSNDPIMQQTYARALESIDSAAVVLFMCDGTVGVVPEDQQIAKYLHKSGRPVVVLINKVDVHATQERLYEFERFGFSQVIPVSAQHGTGVTHILNAITSVVPENSTEKEEERSCRVVLLGKPNVGKSSLMNLLLKEDRSIVSDQPGTTRDAITESVRFYQEDIIVTDTPGIRRKRMVTEDLEQLMTKSSFRAVEDADVVLLLIDASQAALADQELKLAYYAFQRQHKAVICLFNKQDLLTDEYDKKMFQNSLDQYAHLMKMVESMSISCKTGKNVGKIMPLIHELWQRYNQRFSDDELTLLIQEQIRRSPLVRAEKHMLVRRVSQVKTAPITLTVRVNIPQLFEESHIRFVENKLREVYNLKGVPLRILVRK